jgi:hypothetical protein
MIMFWPVYFVGRNKKGHTEFEAGEMRQKFSGLSCGTNRFIADFSICFSLPSFLTKEKLCYVSVETTRSLLSLGFSTAPLRRPSPSAMFSIIRTKGSGCPIATRRVRKVNTQRS